MTAPPLPNSVPGVVVAAAAPPLLVAAALWLCRFELSGWMVGATLGTIVAAILLAPLSTAAGRGVTALLGGLVLASASIAGQRWTGLSVAESAKAACLLTCVWVFAAAIVSVGRSVGWSTAGGTAAVLLIGWLSWPAWLTTAPPRLTAVHPLLALNGIIAGRVGLWTEQPVFYQTTALGQDVPLGPLVSPWACVAVHGGAGLALLLMVELWDRRRPH